MTPVTHARIRALPYLLLCSLISVAHADTAAQGPYTSVDNVDQQPVEAFDEPSAKRFATPVVASAMDTGSRGGLWRGWPWRDRSPANPEPTPPPTPTPTPTPGQGSGQSEFWELSGNLGAHDPTIAEENGIWYEFQTGPGIYRKISYDGGRFWEPLPSVFGSGFWWWRNYVPGQQGTDVWAPDVKAYNGRVWMYYAVSTFGSNRSVIGLASSPSLAADNWRDDGVVISSTTADDFNAIDPDLVIDAAGEPWLTFGSFWSGIKLVKLDRNSMKPVGQRYSLASRGEGIEAPTIVHRDGYYYLFVSVGKCCAGVNSTYRILYGRSRSVTGPYVDREGRNMLAGGGSLLDGGNDRWIGPGGQDIAGTGVIARHAYDALNNGDATLLISNLVWTADGWPSY